MVGVSGRLSIRIPNHYTPALSDLDARMVRTIPAGGNWKNIPTDIPSRRLQQIRESYRAGLGSRSTYYGRLRPDAPAYTISTYINRPGNGCYIHYDFEGGQHRLISQREAARLQSFPDSFVFYGSRNSVNKQIGNAVPPLLAFQVAKQLGDPGCFVDLFCGAGGLSLGFLWAGWQPVVANDIDEAFLETYRRNIHDEVILGDFREPGVAARTVEIAKRARAKRPHLRLFVLGGPPCQGFSTAGNHRSMSDQRNQLYQDYRDFLQAVRPTGFIFENVPGLLNMEGGQVFEMVKSALHSCGTSLDVWKLHAEDYAIPQRRLRVILVGHLTAHRTIPPPPRITGLAVRRTLFEQFAPAICVKDTLDDLPPLEPREDGSHLDYLCPPRNDYQRFMRDEINASTFLERMASADGADH